MNDFARGYIASGPFRGNRVPQHIQNQSVKKYCDDNNLLFVLSRAEYLIKDEAYCQLWAALNEGFKHIVFYSLWQTPSDLNERKKIFIHCMKKTITLHFACERIRIDNSSSFADIEMMICLHDSGIEQHALNEQLTLLKKIINDS